ncbi:hypothetical protein [Diaphorobacter aerolatus]|uniref:Uncharacterized protein n=1 Tax=Diaphorobacter aerolatus TaxID=1288495 RepID=A0A7H0GM70_9BURK|nr:hypothetical protein [Diaphorobacter aerolatus]QNP49386.1 hypothetical protein H9K75_04900 [Diaphorobacter aerolatus]
MGIIYIAHPLGEYDGSSTSFVQVCANNPKWNAEWKFSIHQYDKNFALIAKDFCSLVLQSPGPIVMIRPVQAKTLEEVRIRVATRLPIMAVEIASAADLEEFIDVAIAQFSNGEPLIALDIVVAFLLVRKLDQEHMWSGNSKGYMWASDIPKGRGVDIKYESRVPNVLNILLSHNLIFFKISNSKKKYALNPEKRVEIYEILKSRIFPPEIEGPLSRYPDQVSVRALDVLDIYNPT